MSGFDCKILADSVASGRPRITTMVWTYPRIIHSEVMTHRMLAKSSASSRAIPVAKMIQSVMDNPYVPSEFGKNQRGMQASENLSAEAAKEARAEWLIARDHAVVQAKRLLDIGVHKQLTNRLLEPFMWHTTIITGTDWSNLFNLRDNPAAHPAFQTIAHMAKELYEGATPKETQWHVPFAREGMLDDEAERRRAVARCARISYTVNDAVRSFEDEADLKLYSDLLSAGHMAPFEHVARAMTAIEMRHHYRREILVETPHGYNRLASAAGFNPIVKLVLDSTEGAYSGCLNGWISMRKLIPFERDILGARQGAGV